MNPKYPLTAPLKGQSDGAFPLLSLDARRLDARLVLAGTGGLCFLGASALWMLNSSVSATEFTRFEARASLQIAAAPVASMPVTPQTASPGILPVAAPNPKRQRGAAVPFTTYEAEATTNRLRGTRVKMSALPAGDASTPEMEAAGRAYVQLSKPGDYLEIPRARASNTLVIRHCIPDAAAGGGTSATLGFYVNGKRRQSLRLSSRHNWLYGEAGQNGQSNDPKAGQAHVFWDETRFLIPSTVKAGDAIRLQKDAADSAAFYRIDLVELETAPAALAPPLKGTFLSVADFGARGNDTLDDTGAIKKCIEAAKIARKIVWIPAGNYLQSDKFTLDGVAVRGAGMWRTLLTGTTEGQGWGGAVGFQMNGDGPKVADLAIDSAAHTRRSDGGKVFSGGPDNWRIENVWVTHSLTGPWLEGRNGIMCGSRVRSTYADAINLNNGASHNLIENNHIRGCGDDGIAVLSETEFKKPPSTGNQVRFNTVSAIWWGHNGDIAGGSGHVVQDNIFADNARMGVFTLNLPGGFAMLPLSDTLITRNSFVRGGGNFAWQRRGAIWTYADSAAISNVVFRENLILQPIFRGIHLTGGKKQDLTFERNLIEGPGEDAIALSGEIIGSASFKSNAVRNLSAKAKPLANASKPDFVVTQSGNSWQ